MPGILTGLGAVGDCGMCECDGVMVTPSAFILSIDGASLYPFIIQGHA